MCFAPQRRALFRHLNFQKWSEHGVFCTFWLRNVLRATTACTFSTSQLPKVVRRWGVFNILTSTCASRHNGVHFFDISTSKSGPRMVCFVHFDLEMCFAPLTACTFSTSQLPKVVRRWGVCAFWLRNMLRATTACNFSSLIWPAGSAPAALASLLFDSLADVERICELLRLGPLFEQLLDEVPRKQRKELSYVGGIRISCLDVSYPCPYSSADDTRDPGDALCAEVFDELVGDTARLLALSDDTKGDFLELTLGAALLCFWMARCTSFRSPSSAVFTARGLSSRTWLERVRKFGYWSNNALRCRAGA